MKLDELRAELNACHAKAGSRLGLDAEKIRSAALRATRSAMGRVRVALWIELALNGVAVIGLGAFLASHVSAARFVIPALVLDLFAIAHVVFGARQLVRLTRVDLSVSVLSIQKELERLRAARIRMTKWTLLLGPALWIPLLVVALAMFGGVDAYAVLDRAWLVTNVLFGIAFVPIALWGSKRLVDRFSASPALQRLLRDVAGRNLSAAQGFLDEIARFESSERDDAGRA